MAEDFTAADHLTWDYGAYPTSCPMPVQTGVQKIVKMDVAHEHITDTFFMYSYIKSKYYLYFSVAVYKEVQLQEHHTVN
jgi:hypothetical protein